MEENAHKQPETLPHKQNSPWVEDMSGTRDVLFFLPFFSPASFCRRRFWYFGLHRSPIPSFYNASSCLLSQETTATLEPSPLSNRSHGLQQGLFSFLFFLFSFFYVLSFCFRARIKSLCALVSEEATRPTKVRAV